MQHALQPQAAWLEEHSATQLLATQIWLQPQGGLHTSGWQVPWLQNSSLGHVPWVQVPPQPSLAPQAAPAQLGVQQVPLTHSPAEHEQVPPQPSEPHEPAGQLGVQQLPLTHSPAEQEQVPPQPSEPQALLAQLGVQQVLPTQRWLPSEQEHEPPQPSEPQ